MQVLKTYPGNAGSHIRFFYSVLAPAPECPMPAHRRLPDGTLDIVFNLGDPVLFSRDGVSYSEMPAIALTGLYPDRCFLQYTGTVHLVGAVFRPGSAHLFVNDTLTQYKACTAPASLVYGHGIQHLAEKLRYTTGEVQKHGLLEQYLSQYLSNINNGRDSGRVAGALHQIHELEGNVGMSRLYKSSFMSERTFRRSFHEYVGMSPKQYSLIVRIKSFSKRYELSRNSYTGICRELGYIDQSHFSKDFQRIVGTTPTAYFTQLDKIGEGFIHLI
jgi:AraC-like DNA-binding protein